jgi:hypothetical protein
VNYNFCTYSKSPSTSWFILLGGFVFLSNHIMEHCIYHSESISYANKGFLYIYSEYRRKFVLSGCCFRFQKSTVSGGLQWVHHGCRSEEYQGPESYEAPQPVSEQKPHGQNPGANLWYMLSETCSFDTPSCCFRLNGCVPCRPDRVDVTERV